MPHARLLSCFRCDSDPSGEYWRTQALAQEDASIEMLLAVCLAVAANPAHQVMLYPRNANLIGKSVNHFSIGKEKLNQHSRFVLPYSLRLFSGVFIFGNLENGNKLLSHPVKGKGDDGAGGSIKL